MHRWSAARMVIWEVGSVFAFYPRGEGLRKTKSANTDGSELL